MNLDKVVSFHEDSGKVRQLDFLCNLHKVKRSQILRTLVYLFLHDQDLQIRVLEAVFKCQMTQ